MDSNKLCFLPAHELTHLIRDKQVSCVELMRAHLDHIDRVNPAINALVTLLPERALKQAAAADAALARGDLFGPLHGLPIAHKDLVETRGVRTTYGSPIFADHIPDHDALIVERLRAAGALMIGKTNTPEFGAGSQTFNPVFGATRNPYDLSKTSGGSSGGAAAALAAGMLPIADGSDMGGSLRNPASFCNVVGLRPSPGRVARWPLTMGWSSLAVLGPMARTVSDVALLLAAMSGPDPRDPLSIPESGDRFLRPLDRDFRDTKIAWSPDLGMLPVDKRVTTVMNAQRSRFEEMGCIVEDSQPDFSDADQIFKQLRAWSFATQFAPLLKTQRAQLKESVIWNTEAGLQLSALDIGQAEVKRNGLFQRVHTFMQTYEFMLFPVSQVPPFDVKQEYIHEIEGTAMETYIDWMQSCYFISILGLPAISVPCGFTGKGLPVGLQIVGRYRADFEVLQLAYAFEKITGFGHQRPTFDAAIP